MFHIGVLQALSTAGWHGAQADVIVGTSAGSVVGAAIRAGLLPEEIHEVLDRPPSDEDRAVVKNEIDDRRRSFRPLAPGLARHALRDRSGFGVAVSGLLPPGPYPTWPLTGRGALRFPDVWDRLWIPALETDTGRTIVFGKDSTTVDVPTAIEASCALPGLFQPKTIGGRTYVDGGAVSPSHAHLLVDSAVNIAIISSPMSRPSARPLARMARARLHDERVALEHSGIETLVIEPPRSAHRLFAAYPRRNREVGSVIVAMGVRQASQELSQRPDLTARLRQASEEGEL